MVGEILLLKLFLSLLEDPDAGFTKKGRKSAKISTNKFIENEFFIFNFDFSSQKYVKNWKKDEPNPWDPDDKPRYQGEKVVFNWLYENHGKRWDNESLEKLNTMCREGKSFLEIAAEFKRTETSLMSRLNSMGWEFQLTNHGKLYLVNKETAETINYSPKSIYHGKLILEESWFSQNLTLSFPLPLRFTKKEELMLELEIDGNVKIIEIEDNFMSYIISKKPQTLLNSTNVILRNELLGQVEIDFTQFSKNAWSELYLLTYYFKKINLIL